MYQNERKDSFNFKSFFLTLLLILLVVFLMLFIFPTKWDLKKNHNTGDGLQSTSDIQELSILYDEIFANNVMRMKDAAIGYFTTDRLPKKVGESKKLTLQEMYDLHLVLKMKDKNGKACRVKKSYVEMTKLDNEYHLKVNLSCGDYDDYIIVYLGCYSYCSKGICEKKVEQSSTGKGKVNLPSTNPKITTKYYCKIIDGKYYDAKGDVVSKSEYEKSCSTPKYYCKVVNGKYYDKNGNIVSKKNYEKSCSTPKYYCKVVNGKYYDKNGNIVSKKNYEKSCSTPKYYCKVVNGKYYDKNGNIVSKKNYEKSCSTPKYYCKVVNGKYYDKNGNIVSKENYEKSCTTKKKMYEYKLTTSSTTTCAAWSNWQKTAIRATDTVKVETKTEKEITGYTTKKVQIGTKKVTTTKNVAEKYIAGYTTKLVATGTKKVWIGTTTQTTYTKVAAGTVETYAGIGSGTSVPANTSTTTYKFLSTNKERSCSYCKEETIYTYEIYKKETVYKTVESTVEVPVYKEVTVYEKKEVPVYASKVVPKTVTTEEPIYKDVQEPIYGNVTYYRSKTCKTTPGTTTYKWSYNYPDSELDSQGYKFTGNVKEV